MKRAMVAVAAELPAQHLRSRLILTVHDELVFEVRCGGESEWGAEAGRRGAVSISRRGGVEG